MWVRWHEPCWQRWHFPWTHAQLCQHMGVIVNPSVLLFSNNTALTEAAAVSTPLQKKPELGESSILASLWGCTSLGSVNRRSILAVGLYSGIGHPQYIKFCIFQLSFMQGSYLLPLCPGHHLIGPMGLQSWAWRGRECLVMYPAMLPALRAVTRRQQRCCEGQSAPAL